MKYEDINLDEECGCKDPSFSFSIVDGAPEVTEYCCKKMALVMQKGLDEQWGRKRVLEL